MDDNRRDPPDTHYLPTYTPPRRDAPPSGPPPAYAAAIGKVYPYTLRPVLLFTTFITFLYLVLIAASLLREVGWEGNSAKLNVFDLVQGFLFLAVAVAEVIGFVAAWRANLKLAVFYSRIAIPAYLLVVASQLIGVVTHYTLKDDDIRACTIRNTGRRVNTSNGFWGIDNDTTSYVLSEPQAQDYCREQWDSESTWTIVWLVISIVVGVPFVLFGFAFVRQLRDPSSVRVRVQPMWTWSRQNGQQAASAPYAPSGPYDPQAQSYAMAAYPQSHFAAPSSAAPYAPPPGAPPPPAGAAVSGLPEYQRGSHLNDDDEDFDDRKSRLGRDSDVGEGYGYSLGYDGRSNGAASGRGGDARKNDAAKDSQVTITLGDVDGDDDDDDKRDKVRSKAYDDDYGGPKV